MPLRSIDVNLIVPLRALLRERNVTRAGKAIGLGQSSMSHALARLRAHFGDPLLVQTGRTMVLSARAIALVPLVEEAAERLEGVFSPAPPFDPRSSERVFRVLGTDNLELYLLPSLQRLLAARAPAVTVRFGSLPRGWQASLRNGTADLKLGRSSPLEADLSEETLVEERLVCLVRRGHRAARARLGPRAYAALDHVAIAPTLDPDLPYRSVVDDALEARGLRRRIALTLPHFVVAPFVVAETDLVLTAPERLARHLARPLRLAVIEAPLPLPRYTLSQVWAARADGDDALAWFRGLVAEAFAEHR